MADNLKRRYNVTALQRGLRLLQLFGELARGLTAKQVSARSRLPENLVHRFLANLEGAGFLNRSATAYTTWGSRVLRSYKRHWGNSTSAA